MAKDVADDQIRDTNTYNYPISNNEPGTTFIVANDLDAAVDYTVKGTYESDDDFSDAITLASGETVSADGVSYETLGYSWDVIRFEVTAQSSPSTNSLRIKKMED